MIKHVVMFKLKPSIADETRPDYLTRLKSELDALEEKIPEIKYFETGINVAKSERAYDVVLISEFESLETLEIYRLHPEHLKVVEFIKGICNSTIAVDYAF